MYFVRIFLMMMVVSVAAVHAKTAPAGWTENYEVAKQRARATGKPILAMFTGTDWCPPCKQFDEQVAHTSQFLGYAADKMVLLKLEFPKHMLQSPVLYAQNSALAERIPGVEFPRFYLLNADGEVLTKVDMRVRRPARNLRELYLLAIEDGLEAVAKAKS
jgi:thiol-disulfide isomerase/thioredoxin